MCQNADKALHTLKIKECNHMDTTKEEAVLIATLFEEIDKSSSSSVKIEDNCELGELGVISEIPIVACKQIQPIVASSYAKLNEYFHKKHYDSFVKEFIVYKDLCDTFEDCLLKYGGEAEEYRYDEPERLTYHYFGMSENDGILAIEKQLCFMGDINTKAAEAIKEYNKNKCMTIMAYYLTVNYDILNIIRELKWA